MDTVETYDQMTTTSIKVQMSTRDRLVEHCKKNESYDTFINKLLDEYEDNLKKK